MKNVTGKTWRAVAIVATLVLMTSTSFGQTRNPVLEYCTGTWCQWCPCGEDVIKDDILPAIPNAIIRYPK